MIVGFMNSLRMENLNLSKKPSVSELVMLIACSKSEARDLEKAFERGKTCTYDQIHAGSISPSYFDPLGSKAGGGSSKHSKKLYKLTRQLTHIKKHLVENNDQTYLLGSVDEVIALITSYRKLTRDLPFDWTKQRFLSERHRGAKLSFPPGKSRVELSVTLPHLVYEKSDDEDDTVEGSLNDPNFSRLLDLFISVPLVDLGTKALAVSYLSCLESICKTIDDLSKEKIKRLRDIYKGLGVPEVYTAGGEMQQLKEVYGLTKKGLRSKLEEDRQRSLQSYSNQTTNSVPEVYTAGGEMQQLKEVYGLTKKGIRSSLEEDRQRSLQSYSNQTTNSGPKQASSSKGKSKKLWRY